MADRGAVNPRSRRRRHLRRQDDGSLSGQRQEPLDDLYTFVARRSRKASPRCGLRRCPIRRWSRTGPAGPRTATSPSPTFNYGPHRQARPARGSGQADQSQSHVRAEGARRSPPQSTTTKRVGLGGRSAVRQGPRGRLRTGHTDRWSNGTTLTFILNFEDNTGHSHRPGAAVRYAPPSPAGRIGGRRSHRRRIEETNHGLATPTGPAHGSQRATLAEWYQNA